MLLPVLVHLCVIVAPRSRATFSCPYVVLVTTAAEFLPRADIAVNSFNSDDSKIASSMCSGSSSAFFWTMSSSPRVSALHALLRFDQMPEWRLQSI